MDGDHRDRLLAGQRADHRDHLAARQPVAAGPRAARPRPGRLLRRRCGSSGSTTSSGWRRSTGSIRKVPSLGARSTPSTASLALVEDLHHPRRVGGAGRLAGREHLGQHAVADARRRILVHRVRSRIATSGCGSLSTSARSAGLREQPAVGDRGRDDVEHHDMRQRAGPRQPLAAAFAAGPRPRGRAAGPSARCGRRPSAKALAMSRLPERSGFSAMKRRRSSRRRAEVGLGRLGVRRRARTVWLPPCRGSPAPSRCLRPSSWPPRTASCRCRPWRPSRRSAPAPPRG